MSDDEFDIYENNYENLIHQKVDAQKEKQIRKILNLKYIYGLFLRVLRTLVYLTLVLITVIGICFKSNLYSIFSLIALIPLVFKRFNYKALKEYNCFLVLLTILQYFVFLSNLSPENSPMEFPVPYNPNKENFIPFPVPIPWYTKIDYFKANPDWLYYLGASATQRARNSLWYEWSCIIICSIYFTNFNSIIIDKNMELTMRRSVINIFNQSDTLAQSSVLEESKRVSETNYNRAMNFMAKRNSHKINNFEYERSVVNYIRKIKKTMTLRVIHNTLIDIFCSISSILSLLSLLLMSFSTSGLINLFYVVFCLTFIYQMKNFIFQKNWSFPYYLENVLKPFVYFEI